MQQSFFFSNPMWQYSNNYIQPKQEESIKKKREEERKRERGFQFRRRRGLSLSVRCGWMWVVVHASQVGCGWDNTFIYSHFLVPC